MRSGAPDRIRTCDPLITNQVLYQLSYKGVVKLSTMAGYITWWYADDNYSKGTGGLRT